MTESFSKLSGWVLLTLAGFSLGGSYFVVQGAIASGGWWLLVLLAFMLVLTAILALQLIRKARQTQMTALFLACTLIVIGIAQHAAMLYVVVCLLAIELFPKRTATVWVGICVLAVFLSELLGSPQLINLQDAVVNSILTLFLSGFAYLRLEAERGRLQTRHLLHQLEEKNRQLAQYAAEKEQQSRFEERQRLSRELHDTLGHKLTSSIVQLEAAEKYIEHDTTRVKNIVATVRDLLKDGLHETRNIVRLLDKKEATELPTNELITNLAYNFQSATGLSISVQSDCNDAHIPVHIRQHIFRIVQEALTNISRHAEATNVNIRIAAGKTIELLVEDNGIRLQNYENHQIPKVKSIESRVAELEGTLKFLREDELTKLFIEIPLKFSGGDCAH